MRKVENELNRFIDHVIHKRAKENPAFWLLDFLCHAAIERDLEKSIRKALRYYPKQFRST